MYYRDIPVKAQDRGIALKDLTTFGINSISTNMFTLKFIHSTFIRVALVASLRASIRRCRRPSRWIPLHLRSADERKRLLLGP